MTGMSASAAMAIPQEAVRHPVASMMFAIRGRKTSWPVAQAAPITPSISPRRLSNQRLTTKEPKINAVDPTPSPTMTPHKITRCHGSVITVVRPVPIAIRVKAPAAMLRTPKRPIKAAAKGAVSP